MILIVEDGTGKSDADSLVSLEDCDAYHTARGNSGWTGDDTDKEAALRRASTFMSSAFTWKGWKRNHRDQALAWPRTSVVDEEGWPVTFDEVPREIEDATCEVALRELESPGSMTPDVVLTERLRRLRAGSVELEFQGATQGANADRPILTIVRDMVGGLLAAGSGNTLAGSSFRV